MNISIKRKKRLDESTSKTKLKANKSARNFKPKNKLKKATNDTSEDSDEDEDENITKRTKKNKSKNKKRNIKNKKNFNNSKRSQSVNSQKKGSKKKMLRTAKSDTFKNKKRKKLFTRTTQSDKNFFKKRANKSLEIKQRSRTANTTRYGNHFTRKNNSKEKYFSKLKISSAYTQKGNRIKRSSFDQTNKKYGLISDFDERSRKNFLYNFYNKRRDSEEGLKSLNFRASKYTQNSSNFFKLRTRNFNFQHNYFKEKEDGFYNRITLFPNNQEENQIYERKYLQGDENNPYSVKWPSHMLKIGYNSGFYFDDYQDGVPILRLKKLKNKVILPPIKTRYSLISEKCIDIPPLNFNNLSRQERINLIINTETNNENNVFKSVEARRRLLEKFNINNIKK